ncbi:MAG: hypothetical protein JJU33_01620 [Phycisphaerales bacterium]|nr:hypothetical protein [Phycisphaerales bacterium]
MPKAFLLALWLLCAAALPHAGAQVRVPAPWSVGVPGEPVVIPLVFEGRANPRDALIARLADGRPLTADVYRLSVGAGNDGENTTTSGPLDAWIGPLQIYEAVHNDRVATPAPPGVWVALIRTPPDASGAIVLNFTERHEVRWAEGGLDAESLPTPRLDEPGVFVRGAIERLERDPEELWRAMLLRRRLGEEMPQQPDAEDPRPERLRVAFGARRSVPEAIANQSVGAWMWGLNRIALIDPALASELIVELTRVATIGGERVPAWESRSDRLDDLLDMLTDPRPSEASRRAMVRDWIDRSPRAATFVERDAADGEAVIVATNLSSRAVLVALERFGTAPEPMGTVPPGSSVRVPVGRGGERPDERVRVRIGSELIERDLIVRSVRASAPGLVLGATRSDWSMVHWLTGEERGGGPLVAALLYPGDGSRWRVFIESADPEVSVRLWLGAEAWVEVRPSGTTTSEGVSARVEAFSTDKSGWAFTLGLDDLAGEVSVAIEALSPTGERAAWPRRMLPWQRTPARLGVDLTDWHGVRTEP